MNNLPNNRGQKGIAHLVLILVLLAGIVVSTKLVQQRTNVIPHAECEEDCEEPEEDEPVDEEPAPDDDSDDDNDDDGPLPFIDTEAESDTVRREQEEAERRRQEEEANTPSEPEPEPTEEAAAEPDPEPGQEEHEEATNDTDRGFTAGDPDESFWDRFMGGIGDAAENIAETVQEGFLETGNRIGLVSDDALLETVSENKIEDETDKDIASQSPKEFLADPEIPVGEKSETLEVFADALDLDPANKSAVVQALEGISPDEELTDEKKLALITPSAFSPVQGDINSECRINGISDCSSLKAAIAAFDDEAKDIINQLGIDPADKTELEYALALAYESSGGKQLLLDQFQKTSEFLDYLKQNGNIHDYGNGTTIVTGPKDNDSWDIKNKWSAISFYTRMEYNDFYKWAPQEEIDKRLFQETLKGFIQYETGLELIKPMAQTTKSGLDLLIQEAKQNGADSSSFLSTDSIVNDRKFIVLTNNQMAYYSPTNSQSGEKENSPPAGFYDSLSGMLVFNKESDLSVDTLDHETIHRAADITTPDYWDIISRDLGVNNASKLREGTTEALTQRVNALRGTPIGGVYQPEVAAIEGDLVNLIKENSGKDDSQALGLIIEAGVGGKYEKMIKVVGNGNYSEGVRKMNEFLDKTHKSYGLNKRFPDIIPDVYAKEPAKFVLRIDGVVTPFDKAIAFNNSYSDLNIVGASDKNNPIKGSKSFEVVGKKNLVKGSLKTYGKVDKSFVKKVLNEDILGPVIREYPEKYEMLTGRMGVVSGKLKKGKYKVSVSPMDGYDIKIPSEVDTQKKGKAVLQIAVNKGSGKVSYTQPKGDSFAFNIFNAFAADSTAEVEVVVFADKNSNGKLDRSENLLPWAGVTVSLEATNAQSNNNPSENPAASTGPSNNLIPESQVPFFKIYVPQD